MSAFDSFIFKDYSFDPASKKLELRYNLDDKLQFNETYVFDFPFDMADVDQSLLERALTTLFYVAGVSYFKTYAPKQIVLSDAHPIDKTTAEFLTRTYQRGLGEFFFVNQLDPKTPVHFPANTADFKPVETANQKGKLVGLGGGKDSLVTVELLRSQNEDFATWSVGHRAQLEPLVQEIGKTHYYVERTWDRQLLDIKAQGGLNGHVPISAIFASVGMVVAVLSGHQDVVVSNEQSANEPTLEYQGVAINHQYSKSQVFERDFQQLLKHLAGDSVRYYSFLRPLSELRIAELFAKSGFQKYKSVFSSCNRAFVHTSSAMSWCGECPKCAFVFLALTPFVDRTELEALWGGKNLLLDPSLKPMYKKLLGIEGDKPLDCVGEIKESRSAMRLAQQMYPELKSSYTFEIPANYDYKKIASHEMPTDVAKIFHASLNEILGQ